MVSWVNLLVEKCGLFSVIRLICVLLVLFSLC